MLLLSNQFQTIRINHSIGLDPTVIGPSISTVKLLSPEITKALELKPTFRHITSPVPPLAPSINSVENLKPDSLIAKDLKPSPKG